MRMPLEDVTVLDLSHALAATLGAVPRSARGAKTRYEPVGVAVGGTVRHSPRPAFPGLVFPKVARG